MLRVGRLRFSRGETEERSIEQLHIVEHCLRFNVAGGIQHARIHTPRDEFFIGEEGD